MTAWDNMQLKESIKNILASVNAPTEVKEKYIERLAQGALTRDENLVTHFCSYFFPYRLSDKKVFVIAHKKSGLWLSPGGHIDLGETPAETVQREIKEELDVDYPINESEKPKLLTITYIKSDVRPCKVHFDMWYFISIDGMDFATRKEGEFDDARWVSLAEARAVLVDENNLKALDFIKAQIFQTN